MGLLKKIFKPIVKIFEKAVSLVAKVFSAITSPFGMNIDVPDYDIGTNQADAIQGVLVNKDSAIVSIPVVYGTRRVGGTRVFVSTNGQQISICGYSAVRRTGKWLHTINN